MLPGKSPHASLTSALTMRDEQLRSVSEFRPPLQRLKRYCETLVCSTVVSPPALVVFEADAHPSEQSPLRSGSGGVGRPVAEPPEGWSLLMLRPPTRSATSPSSPEKRTEINAHTRHFRNLLAAAAVAPRRCGLAPAVAGAAHFHEAKCRPGQGTPWNYYIAPPLFTQAIVGHWYQISVYQASSDIVGGAPIHLCAFARTHLTALTRVKTDCRKRSKSPVPATGFNAPRDQGSTRYTRTCNPITGRGIANAGEPRPRKPGTVTQTIRIVTEPVVICDYVTVNGQRGPCSGSSVPPDADTGP